MNKYKEKLHSNETKVKVQRESFYKTIKMKKSVETNICIYSECNIKRKLRLEVSSRRPGGRPIKCKRKG